MRHTKIVALVCALFLFAQITAAADANVFGWEVPAETLTFTVFQYADNWVDDEQQKVGQQNYKDYLLKNFNIAYDFVKTEGSAEEALNLALTANDYPDIVKGISTPMRQKFVDQGRAVELTPYMDASPNIVRQIGTLMGMYLDEAGKLFYLPTEYGALMDLPDYSAHLRYDEWLEIGSPKIETPDDWYNAIMKVLEKYPKTPNGDTRYSLSLYDQGNPGGALAGYWGLKRGWKVAEDNTLTYWGLTEEGKAMSKFFNKFWQSGTMDPDSFINKFDDFRTKVSQEKIVGLIGGWWIGYNGGHEIWSLTNPNWTENMRYFQVGFKAPEAEGAYVTGKNRVGGSWTIITDKAKDPAGIMKFIDFSNTDPGMGLIGWGIPGPVPTFKDPTKTFEVWSIESPTSWKINDEAKQQLLTETWDYPAEGVYGSSQGILTLSINRSRWADGIHCTWLNQMWYDEVTWKKLMFDNMKDTIYDATALAALGNRTEEQALAETAVTDCWKQYWPLVVMSASDAEFETNWTTFQEALKAAEIDVWTDFVQTNYQANLSRLEIK